MEESTGNVTLYNNNPSCITIVFIFQASYNLTITLFPRKPHIAEAGDSNLLKENMVRELKSELQRYLSHLKTNRLKISELQAELRCSQTRAEQLQTQLEQAERTIRDSKVWPTANPCLMINLCAVVDARLTPWAFTTGEGEQLGETPGNISHDCRSSQRPRQTAGGTAGPAGESGGQCDFSHRVRGRLCLDQSFFFIK